MNDPLEAGTRPLQEEALLSILTPHPWSASALEVAIQIPREGSESTPDGKTGAKWVLS